MASCHSNCSLYTFFPLISKVQRLVSLLWMLLAVYECCSLALQLWKTLLMVITIILSDGYLHACVIVIFFNLTFQNCQSNTRPKLDTSITFQQLLRYVYVIVLFFTWELCMSLLDSYTFQKLNTTNECIVSVLGGISSTAHQVHVHVHTVHV